jgi:hypothetical protein
LLLLPLRLPGASQSGTAPRCFVQRFRRRRPQLVSVPRVAIMRRSKWEGCSRVGNWRTAVIARTMIQSVRVSHRLNLSMNKQLCTASNPRSASSSCWLAAPCSVLGLPSSVPTSPIAGPRKPRLWSQTKFNRSGHADRQYRIGFKINVYHREIWRTRARKKGGRATLGRHTRRQWPKFTASTRQMNTR